MRITSVFPGAALPAGIVRIELDSPDNVPARAVDVGGAIASIMGASPRALTIRIPETTGHGIAVHNHAVARAELNVGRAIASDLQPVSNPVVDALGNVYVTYSGTRGEKVPFSVFVVYADGSKHPFLADIVNPTGLAIGPDDYLYITSRHTGSIYRSTFDRQVEKFAEGLGLASGLVFSPAGDLFVGDRSGFIYKISPERETSVVCELEPSVSAYHLAWGPDDRLYVTGPTLATQDCVYRISPEGEVEVFFKGVGRPQGLAFDSGGTLHIAASYRGRRGVFAVDREQARLVVSGPMLVGLAYSADGRLLYLVDGSHLYQIELS